MVGLYGNWSVDGDVVKSFYSITKKVDMSLLNKKTRQLIPDGVYRGMK